MAKNQNPEMSTEEHLVGLADSAWKLLGTDTLKNLEIKEVADTAAVPLQLAEALGGSVQRLIFLKMSMLDQKSILETLADIQDSEGASIREKIVEGLLHRFEVYAPYREQIKSLKNTAKKDPELAIRLLDASESTIRRILIMSGDKAIGLRGKMRVKGVVGVWILTVPIWIKDDTTDLSATMKSLDHRMKQAEEWGTSFGVFRTTL